MYSPSPPAPRKMPPTASASHSLDTPMIMQPATMLSRAEPTRRPWYSPTLTGFIQGAERLRVTMHWIEILLATGNFSVIRRTVAVSFSVTLSDTEALSLAEPPLLFSPAQDLSCIFKWRYQLTISRVVVQQGPWNLIYSRIKFLMYREHFCAIIINTITNFFKSTIYNV